MFRKVKWSIALLLVLGIYTGTAVAELIAYWPFDEGQGTDVSDVTGNGNDGTFVGAVAWVPGIKGSAVRFDVDGERILIGPLDPTAANNAMTLAAWIKWENPPGQDQQGIFGKRIWTPRDRTKWFWEARENGRLSFRNGDQTLAAPAGTLTPYANEWIHVAVTWDNDETIQYINAQEVHSGNITLRTTADDTPVTIGTTQGSETFHGTIEEARIYDTALTPDQIVQAMTGDTTPATLVAPANESTDVRRDVTLRWSPGEFAHTHDVYFGVVFDDVNAASRADPRNVLVSQGQDANTYDPEGLLELGQSYYWRIDEVNAPPDSTIFKGGVWSFTAEPLAYAIENITATASSSDLGREPENVVNGSGLDDSGLLHSKDAEGNMWLSSMAGAQPTWIEFEFDRIYKLHEMWVWNSNESLEPVLGLGCKDVTIEYSADGTNYMTLGTTHEFARAPGTPDYEHNTTIDLSGLAAKYIRLTANSNWGGILAQFGLSEVRFFHIPVIAREPYPQSGARDVSIGTIHNPTDITLGFRAGREAARHDVYVDSDWQAVIDGTAPVTTVTEVSHGPLAPDLGKTYYWRVDEVNEAETPTTWQGPVWDFTTQKYFVVDDFESYNDLDPTDPNSNRIFLTWIDGYEVATNGSLVGYDVPSFAEQTIVHSGKQSMPFFFDNSGTAQYSEATLTLSPQQD
ncbi:MAG: LamG-like jellyroll fold domain-containing protein, partial [Planctomycetota bacterium]